MNKSSKPRGFLKDLYSIRWILTVFIFFGLVLVPFIHEWLHYFAFRYFGYESVIKWSILLPSVVPSTTPSFHDYLFIAMMPYLFEVAVLLLLFLLSFYVSSRKTIAIIAFFAMFDIIINFLIGIVFLIFGLPINDFSTVIRYSLITGHPMLILSICFVSLIIFSTIFLFRPHFKYVEKYIWKVLMLFQKRIRTKGI